MRRLWKGDKAAQRRGAKAQSWGDTSHQLTPESAAYKTPKHTQTPDQQILKDSPVNPASHQAESQREQKTSTISSWEHARAEVMFFRSKKDTRNADFISPQRTWHRGEDSHANHREDGARSTKLASIRRRNIAWIFLWYKSEWTHSIQLIKTSAFLNWLEKKDLNLTERNI